MRARILQAAPGNGRCRVPVRDPHTHGCWDAGSRLRPPRAAAPAASAPPASLGGPGSASRAAAARGAPDTGMGPPGQTDAGRKLRWRGPEAGAEDRDLREWDRGTVCEDPSGTRAAPGKARAGPTGPGAARRRQGLAGPRPTTRRRWGRARAVAGAANEPRPGTCGATTPGKGGCSAAVRPRRGGRGEWAEAGRGGR